MINRVDAVFLMELATCKADTDRELLRIGTLLAKLEPHLPELHARVDVAAAGDGLYLTETEAAAVGIVMSYGRLSIQRARLALTEAALPTNTN